jgi:hypothetical protein
VSNFLMNYLAGCGELSKEFQGRLVGKVGPQGTGRTTVWAERSGKRCRMLCVVELA